MTRPDDGCSSCDHRVSSHDGIAGCREVTGRMSTSPMMCPCASHWNPVTREFGPVPPVARDAQVGGNHYSRFKIQPWDIWQEYELDAFTGSVVKYLLRAGHKGSKLEDLKKARHTLDRIIEIEEGREE